MLLGPTLFSSSKLLSIQIENKHLVVWKKLKAIPKSDIAGKKLRAPLFTSSSHARLISYSAVVT